MRRAVAALAATVTGGTAAMVPDLALVDGNIAPTLPCPVKTGQGRVGAILPCDHAMPGTIAAVPPVTVAASAVPPPFAKRLARRMLMRSNLPTLAAPTPIVTAPLRALPHGARRFSSPANGATAPSMNKHPAQFRRENGGGR